MATLIPFASLAAKLWKNGGGSTTEVAVWPAGAGLDDFVWRISIATIASDGPFSLFPGIDRTLSLVRGQGVDLLLKDGAPRTVALRLDAPTLSFPGEWPIDASLPFGATQDFNVMTRRASSRHQFFRVAGNGKWQRHAATTLLFLASGGPLRVQLERENIAAADAEFVLQQYDSLLLDGSDAAGLQWQMAAMAGGEAAVELFIVEIAAGINNPGG